LQTLYPGNTIFTRFIPCHPDQAAREKTFHLTPMNEISAFADYFLTKKQENDLQVAKTMDFRNKIQSRKQGYLTDSFLLQC